jgi:uncharacterized protein (UPF0333 family)
VNIRKAQYIIEFLLLTAAVLLAAVYCLGPNGSFNSGFKDVFTAGSSKVGDVMAEVRRN